MKKINSDNWTPRNKRALHAWTPYTLITTNPPLVRVDNLYYTLYVYNDITGGLVMFYYILERVVSYNILYEDNYFYEDD